MAQKSKSVDRPTPFRVAIVGGGCAGIAAAWQLVQQPHCEVHVYEKSWCLGGKGASVRDADGRILEHGLHVWLGFYENAFRMMRECYDEIATRRADEVAQPGDDKTADPRERVGKLVHDRIEDAFFPEPQIGVARPDRYGDWTAWSGYLPPAPGLPGEELDERSNPFTVASYLLRCFDLLKTLMLSDIGTPAEDVPGGPRPDERSTLDEAIDLDFSLDTTNSLRVLIERMARLLRAGALTTAAGMLQAVTIIEVWLQDLNFAPQVADSMLQLVEAVAAQTRKQLRDVVAIDPKLRMKSEIIDIVMTIAVGLFRDRVLFDDRGLDAINDVDYRAWLLQHGATRSSVDSRFMTGIYDLVFAYRDGDHDRPALAAGVALRGALRMFFTYRGSMFWRMRSGMGEAVFAPLYRVLRLPDRSMKGRDDKTKKPAAAHFHFLHELASVELDARDSNRRYIKALTFRVPGDPDRLDDLSTSALDESGCWPDDPRSRFAEVVDRPPVTRTLVVGKHFDAVVFAIGIDDFAELFDGAMGPKGEPDPAPKRARSRQSKLPHKWRRMCNEVKTVATKAAQVWISKDLEGLGWFRGSGLITALGVSFETWADMTHTLAAERAWRKGHRVKYDEARSVAYFCAALPERDVNEATRAGRSLDAKVDGDLTKLLRREMKPAWPAAFAKGTTAADLEIGRHVQANFEGSQRYTLSLPGSIAHRISPLDRSVVNMTIAGDWTSCGLDAGCVEAAVISGMVAANALCGEPKLESIIGYDHP